MGRVAEKLPKARLTRAGDTRTEHEKKIIPTDGELVARE